jgi:tol-pal system protein YbgF
MLTGISSRSACSAEQPSARLHWLPLLAFAVLLARPALATAQTDAPPNRGVVQLLNQVEALNGDLSRLRGQMEVLTNEIANAQKRQRDMYVDLDTRMRRIEQQRAASDKKELEGISALEERVRKLEQAAGTPSGSIPAPVSTTAAPVSVPPASSTAAAVAAPPAPITASQPSAAVAAAAPAAGGAASSGPSLPPASLSNADQAAIQRAYDNAYSNYRINDYQGAIRSFDSFLKTYPKHQLAPNAQYWIGESYFQLRDYRAAIEAQRRLLGTYPDSAKVPDALLIIGTAESTLGDNSAARRTFEDLIAKYPATESAEKAKGRLARIK